MSPKSEILAEKLLPIKMLLYRLSAGIELQKNSTYAFQIYVKRRPAMKILQSTSDGRRLREVGLAVILSFRGRSQPSDH